ncbi:MAG: hypothetical protein ACK5X3_12615, partial [Pseudomonadota bacterium]
QIPYRALVSAHPTEAPIGKTTDTCDPIGSDALPINRKYRSEPSGALPVNAPTFISQPVTSQTTVLLSCGFILAMRSAWFAAS